MDISKSLALWANRCLAERKDLLNQWLDEAILAAVNSGGQSVASTSTNGVAITFATNGMTLDEWIAALTNALAILENPQTIQRKAIQIFR